MLKDIFIDNNVAKNLANPLDHEYKRLVAWLMTFDERNAPDNAYLVLSNKLLGEYMRTTGNSSSVTNITVVINKMTREGRIVKISNQEIKDFQREHFSKRVLKRLTCNRNDLDHIPVVLLSFRKYALSLDKKFVKALVTFPGFTVVAAPRPEDLPYDQ